LPPRPSGVRRSPARERCGWLCWSLVWQTWLGEETVDSATTLKRLLAPYPADDMVMWPVDKRVGNVRNNDPALIEPVA